MGRGEFVDICCARVFLQALVVTVRVRNKSCFGLRCLYTNIFHVAINVAKKLSRGLLIISSCFHIYK